MALVINMMNIPFDDWTQWNATSSLLGGLFFVGLFNIVVFLFRRRLKVHYYFGMICIFYVIWYSSRVIELDVFPLNVFNAHHMIIIAAIATNRMALHLSLYTMHTLQIVPPTFEKVLKIGSDILLVACFFMPFSIVYTTMFVSIIELFNALIQVYFSYVMIRSLSSFWKDIRIIPAICYFFICIATVMQFLGIESKGNTIYLAFFMMALQGVILSLHYNRAIIEVERANELLEKKVEERTADLLKKEQEIIHLISSVSHDLRTPITVVSGYMELLQSDSEVISEAGKKYINHSLVRLAQMEKLTLDLFTLSQVSNRNYTFTFEPVQMNEVVGQITNIYIAQAERKQITIEVQLENVTCIADRMRVFQVLDNLMTNALTYAKSQITITMKKNNDKATVAVYDDGIGIASEDLPYVFDRFYKKTKQGSGLGLSNVKELVERMDGQVTVASEVTKWTRFSFTLPVARNEAKMIDS